MSILSAMCLISKEKLLSYIQNLLEDFRVVNCFRKITLFFGLLILSVSQSSYALVITDDIEAILIPNVGSAFQTVNTQQSYADMVVVCTYALPSIADEEAIVRIDNITGSSFDLRLQSPPNGTDFTPAHVYCIVADEGTSTLPDGTIYDARKVDAPDVVGNVNNPNWLQNNMVNVSAAVTGAYNANEQPAVLGQVISFNDPEFSLFTSSDCENRVSPPFTGNGGQTNIADGICVGKHVGRLQLPAAVRETEELGYIVVEQAIGSFGGINYRSELGPDTVVGVDNGAPITYAVGFDYDLGAATQANEDGSDGGWAVFYGSDPFDGNNLDLAIDEETIGGNNRAHTTEQVSYWIFSGTDHGDAPASYGDASHTINGTLSIGSNAFGDVDDADAEENSFFSADAMGDDNDNLDDENGVVFNSLAGGDTVSADVEINNPKGETVNVCAWLDMDIDGTFDPADGICQVTSAVNPTLTFDWPGLANTGVLTTFVRVRVTPETLTVNDPTGAVMDGEVEDYQVSFNFNPTAVTISDVSVSNVPILSLIDSLNLDELTQAERAELISSLAPELIGAVDLADVAAIETALIEHFDPDSNGAVPVFRWVTSQEQNTIGFYAERLLADGTWHRINQQLLPGLITAPLGGEYLLFDPSALESEAIDQVIQYRLIELEADGDLEEYGPFDLMIN